MSAKVIVRLRCDHDRPFPLKGSPYQCSASVRSDDAPNSEFAYRQAAERACRLGWVERFPRWFCGEHAEWQVRQRQQAGVAR